MSITNSEIERINNLLKDAIFQYNRKNNMECRALFEAVLEKDPTNPEANYYLGLMYCKKNNWSKAVLHFKNVVDLGVNFLYTYQCRMLLGYIYFNNQNYERAEYEYLEVLKSNLNIVQVNAALAAIKYHLNDREAALKYAEKACKQDSYNLNAKNTYAFLLCEYDIDVDRGLEMLREVIRIKPHNAAYLDSLGWAYYKKGDKRAALASLRKAVEISNNHPEIKKHFEHVYHNL